MGDWPRTNQAGAVYPTASVECMAAALGISQGESVLDVGGGARALPEATVVVDIDLVSGHDRDGLPATPDERYICASIEALPFPDDKFDFVYCSHVLEHVRDPVKACRELLRVGKRGYIETPSKLAEMVAGYPSHRWLVDIVDGTLTFERRWFIEHPLQNMALAHILNFDNARERALVDFRNISCVQMLWQKAFDFRVAGLDGWQAMFEYDNPIHAGWSHFFFSLNLLANGAPPGHVAPHVAIARKILPEEGLFCALQGVVAAALGDAPAARAAFADAERLGCEDASLPLNRRQLEAESAVSDALLHLPLNRGRLPRHRR